MRVSRKKSGFRASPFSASNIQKEIEKSIYYESLEIPGQYATP
jgi:hypothetical protein